MTHVLSFDDYQGETVRDLGGKGLNLCKLRGAGFNVPDGFCVTVAAFDAMLDANSALADLMQSWINGETDHATIAAVWEKSTLPAALADELEKALAQLGHDGPLAVRSSAIVEDSSQFSFAGQFDTKLGVIGSAALLDALKACWASLCNETLRHHLHDRNLTAADLKMAVVVQRMIQPRAAGVLFTVDPISQNRAHLRIESNYGLGEALVSGDITPDSLVVDRQTGNVLSQQIAAKIHSLEFNGDALTSSLVDEDQQERLSLTGKDIAILTSEADKIESWAGTPQDIEWAFDGDTLHVVQSRDITTLADLDSALFTPQTIDGCWTRENMDERYNDVASPFTISTLYPGLEKGLEATFNRIGIHDDGAFGPIIKVFYGRPYLNKTLAMHALKGIKVDNTQMEAVLGDRKKVGFNPRLPLIGLGVVRMISRSADEWLAFQRDALDPLQLVDEDVLAAKPLEALHADFAAQREIMDRYWVLHMLNVRSADFCQKIIRMLLSRVYATEDAAFEAFCRLSAGFTENITFESDAAIYRLSRRILAKPALADALRTGPHKAFVDALEQDPQGEDILAEFDALIARFGNKLSSQEFMGNQWRDDPRLVWQHIASAMADTEGDPKDRVLAKKADRAKAYEEALTRFKGPLGMILAPAFKWAYRRMCAYMPSRENDQFQFGKVFYNARRTVIHMGQRLVNIGALERAEDIFMVEIGKIPTSSKTAEGVDLKPYVARQRALYDRYSEMQIPYNINDADKPIAMAGEANSLTGYAVSTGSVTAVARIAHDPSDLSALESGQILVTHSTNPAWTPAFGRLSALVTEAGGLLSHGAIMAREYNIPAVLGVRGATTAITSGEVITVNGTEGIVSKAANSEVPTASALAAE